VLEFDPIASMRMWAVEIEAGERLLRIPPLPAADWMPCLMRMDVMGVLDLAEDVDLDDALMDGEITTEQARDAAVKLLESAAGRTCWTSMALVALATRYWMTIGADLMRMSVKFDQISLGAALDAIYGSLTKGLDEKGLKRLNVTLERAPLEFQIAMGQTPVVEPSRRPVKQLPAIAEQYVRVRPKTVLRRPQDHPSGPNALPTGQPEARADNGLVATTVSPPVDGDSHPAVSPESDR
jgi:hypothetical protein